MNKLPDTFEVSKLQEINIENRNYDFCYLIKEIIKSLSDIDISIPGLIGYEDYDYFCQYNYRPDLEIAKTLNKIGLLEESDLPGIMSIDDSISAVENNKNYFISKAKNNNNFSIHPVMFSNNVKYSLYNNKLPLILSIRLDLNNIKDTDGIIYKPTLEEGVYSKTVHVICFGGNEDGYLIQPLNNSKKTYTLSYDYPLDTFGEIKEKEI